MEPDSDKNYILSYLLKKDFFLKSTGGIDIIILVDINLKLMAQMSPRPSEPLLF